MLEKPAIDLLNRHGEDFDAAQVCEPILMHICVCVCVELGTAVC